MSQEIKGWAVGRIGTHVFFPGDHDTPPMPGAERATLTIHESVSGTGRTSGGNSQPVFHGEDLHGLWARFNRWGQLPEGAEEVTCRCGHHSSRHGFWRPYEATPCNEDGCGCSDFRPLKEPPGSYVSIVPPDDGAEDKGPSAVSQPLTKPVPDAEPSTAQERIAAMGVCSCGYCEYLRSGRGTEAETLTDPMEYLEHGPDGSPNSLERRTQELEDRGFNRINDPRFDPEAERVQEALREATDG